MGRGGEQGEQRQEWIVQTDAVQEEQGQGEHQGGEQPQHRGRHRLGQQDHPGGHRQHQHGLDRSVRALQVVEGAGEQQTHQPGIGVQQERREPPGLHGGQQREEAYPDQRGPQGDRQDLITCHPFHFALEQFDKRVHATFTPVTRMKMSSMLVSPLCRVSISFSLSRLRNSAFAPIPSIGKLRRSTPPASRYSTVTMRLP